MAEYIDRNKIPWAKVDNPKGVFWERVVFESAINNIPPADVIERFDYNKLETINQELWAENEDLERKLDLVRQIVSDYSSSTTTKILGFDKIDRLLGEE